MTNALAQNIQTTDGNTAIDVMMQAVNVPVQSKVQEQGNFSNIINNLESKTQKTQSDFDKQAKVTNVSSINKKALDKKEINNTSEAEKNIQSAKSALKESEKLSKNAQVKNAQKTTASQDKKVIKEESNNFKTTNNEVVSDKTETKTINETENLSDINNSSPVESSPVFSSDEIVLDNEAQTQIENALDEVELNIEQILNSLPVSSENIKVEIKELNTTLENIETIDDIKEIVNKIESISSNLDNSTLNQDEKSEISKALQEMKVLLKDTQENIQKVENFDELMNELKEDIVKLFENKDVLNLANEIDIKKEVENVVQLEKEPIKDLSKELKNTIDEIKNIISNSDIKNLEDVSQKLTQVIEKVDSLIQDKKDNFDLKLSDELTKSLKNLQDILKQNISLKEDLFVMPQKEIDIDFQNDIFETLDKLSSDVFKNVDLKDEKTIKEITELLDNLDNKLENQELSEEVKIKVEELVKNIKENNISTDELTQAIDNLSDEIKVEIEKQDSILTQNIENADVVEELNSFSNNQDSKNQTFNKEKQFDLNEIENDNLDLTEFVDADYDFEEVKLQGSASKNVDVKNIEQNLQKTIAINEMLDEMMVEVDIKTIPSQSGALSVADEITKLAMGETSSLNSITTPAGSVTYDAVGVNAVIKNVANLAKTTQAQNLNSPSMEDVLNQVANKVTQLKDANAQKLTMILRPNDLGRLSIELTSNQQGLTTQIMAQNEDVRAYIERNIDSLRQQLSDAGVNVNSIQIKTAGSEGSTTYDGNQNLNRDFEQENQNQQNNKDGKNNQQNNENKDAKEILAKISNYDMSFAKDFSSVLSKSLNYNLN